MIFLTGACENPHFLRVIYFIKLLLNFAFILVPIILILFLTIDFFKSMMEGNDFSKNRVSVKRVIACVLVFLVYNIVNIFLNLVSFSGFLDCYTNASVSSIALYQDVYNDEHPEIADLKVHVKLYEPKKKYKIIKDPDVNYSSGANTDFLITAEKVWKKIANGNYSYGGTSIPATYGHIDCSSYVSWVLYEYGYKDFKGWQRTTVNFLNDDYSKYGWTTIDVKAGENVTKKLQPGDILVRGSKTDAGSAGHVNIIVKVENGVTYAYDCGSASSWRNSGGNPVDKSYFSKGTSGSGTRAGKIIRVVPPKS